MRALLSVAVLSIVPLSVGAQQPQKPQVRTYLISPQIRVDRPTVVGFSRGPSDSAQTVFAKFQAVAEQLGFEFVRSTARELPIVLDVRYNAVHYVPEDASAGFILLVPGRRSDLVRGLVSAEELRERILAYSVANPPLGMSLRW